MASVNFCRHYPFHNVHTLLNGNMNGFQPTNGYTPITQLHKHLIAPSAPKLKLSATYTAAKIHGPSRLAQQRCPPYTNHYGNSALHLWWPQS